MPKAHPLFRYLRPHSALARKRLDIGIVIAGLIIAFVLGVLTWISFQNRDQSVAPSATDKFMTLMGQFG